MDKNVNPSTNSTRPGVKTMKSSTPGVTIIEFTEDIPQGFCRPDIERRPVPLTMQEGKSTHFKVAARGNPEPTVVWNFKGEDLSNSSKHSVYFNKTMNEHVLQIKKLTADDAGSYNCIVSNEYGEAKCKVNLNIIEDAYKKKFKKPGEVEAKSTDPVDFRKMLKRCVPSSRKKEENKQSENVWDTLMHADKKDYERICMEFGLTDFRGMLKKLTQMKKEREEKQAMYVKEIDNLKHVTTKPDGSASFGFDMELKNPLLNIYVYKDGKLIKLSMDEEQKHHLKRAGKKYTFCIKNLQLDDVGMYKVNVEDVEIFVTEVDINLIPIEFKQRMKDVKCKENNDAVFECTISLPLPAEWSYKKLTLENSDKYEMQVSADGLTHKLIIKDAHPVDKGVYTISAGAGCCGAYLTVEKNRAAASPASKGLQIDFKRSRWDFSDKNLKTKDHLKKKNGNSSEDDSSNLGGGGLRSSSADKLDDTAKNGQGGDDRSGKDGSNCLDNVGKGGIAGIDGMSKDGMDKMGGLGTDDKGALNGMGKGGDSRVDGMEKDGKGNLDGVGKDDKGSLDGVGKDGKGSLDGVGKDGTDGLDGMGIDGKGILDGMENGGDKMHGSGINNQEGLDGSGKVGQNGLDISGQGELQNSSADGLTGYNDSTGAGTDGNNQFGLNDIDALSMPEDPALSLDNQKGLLGEDQTSNQNESASNQGVSSADAYQKHKSGSSRRRKGKLSERDINELTEEQDLKNKEPARRFKSGLLDVHARKGEAAELCCVTTNQNAQGTWFKDDTQITSGDRIIAAQEGAVQKLTIENVQEEDSGTYRFEADGGKTEASLFIEDPPEFDQDVIDQLGNKITLVKAGDTATVKVPFSGKSPMKVSWYKDGEELFEDDRISIDNSKNFTQLSISKCNRKDSGNMTIKLKNESGMASTDMSLLVTDKPQAPQGPVEVLKNSENCISFKWKPPKDDGGQSIEHYEIDRQLVGRNTWTKVGEVDKSTTTFSFDKVEPGKKYKFKVLAVNSEGISEGLVSDIITARRKAVPGPPENPNILNANSNSITISWTPPHYTGDSKIIGYIIEKRKKGSNTWSAVTDIPITGNEWTVTDVVEGMEYEFRVIAVNFSGPGEPSGETEAVFAREAMKVPGTVRDFRVTDTTYSTISLAWNPPIYQDDNVPKGYIVEMKTSGSTTWMPCNTADVGLTSYTLKGLTKMGMYYLRVRAFNDGGMGEPIELDNYILAMPPPVGPKFIMDGSIKGFMVIKEGNSIRVRMPFEASPPPQVVWLKDGFPLSEQAMVTSTSDDTQLIIPVSQRSDSGIYCVTLKNLYGQESFWFEIRVTDVPKPPGPVTLGENVPFTVTVSWEPSKDEPLDDHVCYVVMKRDSSRLTWHTVGENIYNNKFTDINIVPGRNYYFRVLAKNDMGCSESSDTREPWCISKQREPFTLKLPNYKAQNNMSAPEFIAKLKTHFTPSGCDINMTCAVKGCPRPEVTWLKDNIAITDTANFWSTNVYGVCSLYIFGASSKENGEYTAIAENSVGRAMTSTRLVVRGN
ncbi:immunoglobulin-like and fibronectin type III domain-containing protein 1 [Scyliorhinus canicula]|uniref:immunoglobulin-like and fibronectin type III domain-containing protein 1 n=1 Tax=Scyliorhinus canicula TaxID=7830 RepID=UPI0018F5D181|nr:immunoglobulin-like and fibronectin type III domain-containing protein 1 [Scyliorhinus canicula]